QKRVVCREEVRVCRRGANKVAFRVDVGHLPSRLKSTKVKSQSHIGLGGRRSGRPLPPLFIFPSLLASVKKPSLAQLPPAAIFLFCPCKNGIARPAPSAESQEFRHLIGHGLLGEVRACQRGCQDSTARGRRRLTQRRKASQGKS